MPSLSTTKRWNDKGILTHDSFKTILAQWEAIEHEGDNSKEEMRILGDILKCQRDVFNVRVWLRQAFQPGRPEPNLDTVEIYLNFFSKLKVNDDDAFRYLNEERRKLKLSQLLGMAQSWTLPPPERRLVPNLRFTKTATRVSPTIKYDEQGETTGTTENRPSSPARPSVKLQPTTHDLGLILRSDEQGSSSAAIPKKLAGNPFVKSEDMVETTVFSQIEPEGEPLSSKNGEEFCDETSNLQVAQDGSSHETDTEVKSEELVHDIQSLSHIGDALPDLVGYLDQTLADQIPSDEPRRTKRRKFDRTSSITTETRLLPPDSSSISNEVPCIPQGKTNKDGEAKGKSFLSSAMRPSKRIKLIKGKRAARSSPPNKVGPESHPLQDGGILDVCRHPSSDHNHLDMPDVVIMGSEGGQQAQGSQPTDEDLELVTLHRKHQSSKAVLDFEEISSCCTNSVSMGDSEKLHLTSSNLTAPKAKLPKWPPIWAESRQEVCEAFDWFRSYQGGVYHTDNTVKGYLLSAFASKRDVFENSGRLIISHGGGKSESIGSQKGLFVSHQASDQLADDKSVRALLDNYRSGRPLVLMVDDKYARFPYDLLSEGVTYAVLGFYSIVYAWAEFETAKNEVGRVIRYKFAFQWCKEQGPPWWCFAETGAISEGLNSDKAEASGVPRIVSQDDFSRKCLPPKLNLQKMGVCSFCGGFSHQVYSTWVCLTTNCEMFWKNPGTMEFIPESLEYHKGFFALLPRLALPSGLNLMPETTVTRAMNGTSTSYAFTRGIHCPSCGRLSSRYQWEQLECRACNWTKKADIDIRSAEDFWGDRLPISFEYFHMSAVSDFIPGPIRTFKHEGGRGAIQTFTLPYNRGYIHHIRTPSATGMLEANNIFKHYQEQAKSGTIRFRRWPLKAHKCRGTLLTNYFSHNAGEPYQYVGSDANTVPFEQVPAVIEARQLIQDRILQSLDKTPEFNEVLSCAYMERQKMAFHSDAEVGLGPLVAGLSLGSPALMHFRIVARHDPLYERRGVLLTVVLRHGDVLVMDGNGVQEYYEHTVVPNNFRIAATARQISPKHHRQE